MPSGNIQNAGQYPWTATNKFSGFYKNTAAQTYGVFGGITLNAIGAGTGQTLTTSAETDGEWLRFDTSAVLNNLYNFCNSSSATDQYVGMLPDVTILIKTEAASVVNQRIWWGLSQSAMGTNATLSGNTGIGFMYDTNSGVTTTNWVITTNSANGVGTQTAVDTGIAVTADTPYRLRFYFSDVSTINFLINELLVGQITTTIPSTSTGMKYNGALTTLETATHTIKTRWCQVLSA